MNRKLLFTLVAALMCAQGASAYNFVSNGIYYNITGSNTVEVTYRNTNYDSYSGSVIVPSSVSYNNTNYTVTSIGKNAFLYSNTLLSVCIPNTVTMIKDGAFAGTALSRVVIPNSVAIIDQSAFCNCDYLEDIIIGSGVTYIGDHAFGFGVYEGSQFEYPTQKVLCTASTPPIFGFMYGEDDSEYTCVDEMWYAFMTRERLYVPNNSLSRYNSADGWRLFREIKPLGQYYGNAAHIGGYETSIDYWTGGDYPWIVDRTDGVLHVQSGNAGCANSTSELNATVTIPGNATLSFDFKAWGEGTSYDKCIFLIDGEVQFSYGARDNDWETYFVNLSRGTHTLTWKYTKDGSVNPTGDYFALDNVTLAALSLAYACYTSSNQTLTFYNDNERDNRTGKIYSLNTGDNTPGWVLDDNNESITRVVFDSAFAAARPTSTCYWFYMENLESITGFEYLNTSAVTNMNEMFYGCGLTSLDLSSLNTSKVTTMRGMFEFSYFSSLDLSSFNTANVTNMSDMFSFSAVGSVDMSNFNTSKVTDMGSMFESCGMLTSLNLASFNTVKVTDMERMFRDCNELTYIYVGREWTTAAVTSSNEMFKNCTSIRGQQGTTYSSSHVDKGYAHIDGGTSNPGYLTAATEAYACYTSSNTTLTFYYDNQRANRSGTTYDLNTGDNNPGWYTDSTCRSVTRVVFNPSFANARPTSTAYWFCVMKELTSITGMREYLNTSEVTTMYEMFLGCSGLTSLDLSGFNTANVTAMGSMFYGCSGLTSLDLSSFNTANVKQVLWMFCGCSALKSINLGSFNTANVISLSSMFRECSSLTSLDLSSFNTSNVESMQSLFQGCSSLTSLDLSSFNTENVTWMPGMFRDCSSLTEIDLSSFNTSNVENMQAMFQGCSSLTVLDLSSFNTANVNSIGNMFRDCSNLVTIYAGRGWATYGGFNVFLNCTNLVGGMGTTYYLDGEALHSGDYAHIDEGPDYYPGLFTAVTEGYAYFTSSDSTLTFYYDNQWYYRPGTTYAMNEGENDPGWYGEETTHNMDITRVVFDPSFADARPTSTYEWFASMENLDHFEGLNYLNTSEVTTMKYMFNDCSGMHTADLSNFDTRKVTDMLAMFALCYAEELDLSSFSTENVTNMSGMFALCSLLKTIYVGDTWSTSSVTNSDMMFVYCNSLVGGQGTVYDEDHNDKAYAHIDGGPSNPGYFTQGPALTRGDVDGDGTVGISDVTALIDYILSGDATDINLDVADCDQNGEIGISDVTALIDYLLNGSW